MFGSHECPHNGIPDVMNELGSFVGFTKHVQMNHIMHFLLATCMCLIIHSPYSKLHYYSVLHQKVRAVALDTTGGSVCASTLLQDVCDCLVCCDTWEHY